MYRLWAFLYEHDGNHYSITAAAKMNMAYQRLMTLRNTIGHFLLSVIVIFLQGSFGKEI